MDRDRDMTIQEILTAAAPPVPLHAIKTRAGRLALRAIVAPSLAAGVLLALCCLVFAKPAQSSLRAPFPVASTSPARSTPAPAPTMT